LTAYIALYLGPIITFSPMQCFYGPVK